MMEAERENAEQTDQAAADAAPTLEAKVAAGLAELRGEVVKEKKETSPVKEEVVLEPEEVTPESESEKDEGPILPSGHRRAALAHGWTNEEVDHFLETKPDEAVKEIGKIYEDWRTESSLWSKRGRELKATDKRSSEDGEKKVLSHYDAKALIEAHPESEDLINDLVGPLNAAIDGVKDVAERLSGSEKFLKDTETNALEVATQEFLTSKDMKPFADTYGVEIKDLTEKQVDSRMELFEQADELVAGAAAHGKDISVAEALGRAHIILSKGTREDEIRQKIRESMERRTKTTRGSHQQASAPDKNQELSEAEFEKSVAANMAAIRNKSR